MHHLGTRLVEDADTYDHLDAVGDGREVGWIEPGLPSESTDYSSAWSPPSACPSRVRRRCKRRSRAPFRGGCGRRSTSGRSPRRSPAPCAAHAARSTRKTGLAASSPPRKAGCRPAAAPASSTADKWRSCSSWRRILWPAQTGPTGIWRHTRSRAYCSGCLEPGSRLAGHTTGAHTGASGPSLDRDGFSPRVRLRAGDTPDRGDRCTTTGEQWRRHRR